MHDLILKRNGKLYRKDNKSKKCEVTNIAYKFLFENINIENGVTLRKFLNLFNSNSEHMDINATDTLDSILTSCWFKDLMIEAFRLDGKTDSDLVSINIGRNSIELHEDKYIFTSTMFKKNKQVSIEPYTVGNHWFNVDGTGRDGINYGIWTQSITHYMDIPLFLKPTFDIYKYKVIKSKKHKRNIEKDYKIAEVETEYKIIDVLYAICWEMTFDGVYTLEDEVKGKNGEKTGHELMDTVRERSKILDKNLNKPTRGKTRCAKQFQVY